MDPVLTIDIVSDVVCPWCYIGKRKLEAALALPGAAGLPAVEVRWHPFQLNPDLPSQGISRKQYLEDKFGGMLRAFQFGAPPHGGAAFGIDRVVMLLCGVQNLREITLFPMNQQAEDLLMGAPSQASPKQLRELAIRVMADSK